MSTVPLTSKDARAKGATLPSSWVRLSVLWSWRAPRAASLQLQSTELFTSSPRATLQHLLFPFCWFGAWLTEKLEGICFSCTVPQFPHQWRPKYTSNSLLLAQGVRTSVSIYDNTLWEVKGRTVTCLYTASQNHKTLEIGRVLKISPSPTPLPEKIT